VSERLIALAVFGARVHHEWFFDAAENIDDVPTEGHVNDQQGGFGFAHCPHPDCRLVRDAAIAPARASFTHDDLAAIDQALLASENISFSLRGKVLARLAGTDQIAA